MTDRVSTDDGGYIQRLLVAGVIWCLYTLLIVATATTWGGAAGIVVATVGGAVSVALMLKVRRHLQRGRTGNR